MSSIMISAPVKIQSIETEQISDTPTIYSRLGFLPNSQVLMYDTDKPKAEANAACVSPAFIRACFNLSPILNVAKSETFCRRITTLMSNSPRVFVSNAAMRRSFTDKKLNVRILKPKAMLNEGNIHYFQFLDILKLVGETPIDNKHSEFIFKRFVESYDLKLDLLILCAYRFYEKDVLEAVLHFVEKLKGAYLGISA